MLDKLLWTAAAVLPFAAALVPGRMVRPGPAGATVTPLHAAPPLALGVDPSPGRAAADGPAEAVSEQASDPPSVRESTLRRPVAPHEAVMRLLAWMRDHGFEGWHTAGDMLEFYEWFSDEESLETINHDLLLERLAAAPGAERARKRLLGVTEPALVRIRDRLGVERPTLYRIASHEEMAEAAAAETARREAARARRRPAEAAPLRKAA